MKKKAGKQIIKLQGNGTIGKLIGQYLLSNKSNKQDKKVIEKLMGIKLDNKKKRTRTKDKEIIKV